MTTPAAPSRAPRAIQPLLALLDAIVMRNVIAYKHLCACGAIRDGAPAPDARARILAAKNQHDGIKAYADHTRCEAVVHARINNLIEFFTSGVYRVYAETIYPNLDTDATLRAFALDDTGGVRSLGELCEKIKAEHTAHGFGAPPPRYYTRQQIASAFGNTEKTIKNRIKRGAFPPPDIVQKPLLWSAATLARHGIHI